MDETTYITELT